MPKLKQEQWLTMSYDVILLFFSAACTQQRPKVNVGVILHACRDVDAWYPLEVYPNTQNSGSQDRDQRKDHWHQFPLLGWDDDDKRETVSNTKVSKRQTFSNKTLCRSCELSFKVVGYSERDQQTIPHNHLSEDTLKPRTFSSFLCASSELSYWAWILVGGVTDVWNLVVWVQNLVALQTVW